MHRSEQNTGTSDSNDKNILDDIHSIDVPGALPATHIYD